MPRSELARLAVDRGTRSGPSENAIAPRYYVYIQSDTSTVRFLFLSFLPYSSIFFSFSFLARVLASLVVVFLPIGPRIVLRPRSSEMCCRSALPHRKLQSTSERRARRWRQKKNIALAFFSHFRVLPAESPCLHVPIARFPPLARLLDDRRKTVEKFEWK